MFIEPDPGNLLGLNSISVPKMLRRLARCTLINDFKVSFHQYLRETTVHGFRYLIEGRNICEIAVWMIAITFCIVMAICGIYTSIRESYEHPILTSIQTTQIQKVSCYINRCLKYIIHIKIEQLHRFIISLYYIHFYILGPISRSHCTCC